MASGESKPGGFKVTDRRAFTEAGKPGPEGAAPPPASASATASATPAQAPPAQARQKAGAQAAPGAGDQAAPGAGDQAAPGAGDQAAPDVGAQAAPEAGAQAAPDVGAQAAPEAGAQAAPDVGAQAAPEAGAHAPSEAASRSRDATALPAVDFHTFVLSLGSSALLHLGELEHPDVHAPQIDLPLAKHTIDILAMLADKTKGNLTPAEDKLILEPPLRSPPAVRGSNEGRLSGRPARTEATAPHLDPAHVASADDPYRSHRPPS